MKSPDREVPRFTEDLFDLWDGSFEDVPPLHSFILSWDDVQVEIDTGNWREVVEMADRLAGQERPDDLEAAIQKARQMVICLDNLIKAVKDDRITKVLHQHKRSGVPLVLVYPPVGEAIVLPPVMSSPGKVLEALEKAARTEP